MAGRPSPIDNPIEVDGQTMTVADAIILRLRAGNYLETAAAAVGLHRSTVHEWLKVAAHARAAATEGQRLTAHQTRCIAFSDSVDEAEARWEANALLTLERLGRGGLDKVEVTEKRGPDLPNGQPGVLLERITKTSQLAPQAGPIQWRLTRKHPDRFGDQIAVTGAGGGPVELSMDERAAALLELVAQVKAAAPKESVPVARDSAPEATKSKVRAKRTTKAQPRSSAKRPRAGNDPQA